MLLAVPAHNTSRTCPCCVHVSKDNRQTQAKFLCIDCGYENHAAAVGQLDEAGTHRSDCANYCVAP
ncbi:zinc ribbon domain-containing protein [Undibacterium sp. WLX3042]|uniref:zinc ribbon domain-containing protein n=1 Tax=Undibacterium sp. WLX3042 TaxID=3412686 RepID=UPI003C304A43